VAAGYGASARVKALTITGVVLVQFAPSTMDGKPVAVRPLTPICVTREALEAALPAMHGGRLDTLASDQCLAFRQPVPARFLRPIVDAQPLDEYEVLLPGGAVVKAWTISMAVRPTRR
jgi:hypothetical protein